MRKIFTSADIYVLLAVMVMVILHIASASAAIVEEQVYDELNNEDTVNVLIEFNSMSKSLDKSVPKYSGISSLDNNNISAKELKQQVLEARKIRIKNVREEFIAGLKKNHGATISEYKGSNNSDGIKIKRTFTTVNVISATISQEDLEELKNNPYVKKIHAERQYSVQLSDTIGIVNATVTHQVIIDGININGTGQTVCVVDTGIDYNHSDLGAGWGNVVLDGYDYANDDNNPMDDHSHGTHVAGIIASRDSTYKGIAPGVNLVALKVCNSGGYCAAGDMVAGVDWCVNNASKYNITVISMSLGNEDMHNSTNCPTWLTDSINAARAAGITFVASSGNNGTSVGGKEGISHPACVANATSVGAVTKADVVTSYSDTSSLLDLLAPGSSITSTVLNDAFGSKSGTSMAAPHVSAAIALVSQFIKLQDNRDASPLEIVNVLKDTGKNLTDAGNSLVFPRIDIYSAILSLDNKSPVINITSPIEGFETSSESYMITASANELIASAVLELNSTSNISMDISYTVMNLTITGKGYYSYKVFATDAAGNTGVSVSRIILLNNSAPSVESYYPAVSTVNIAEPSSQLFNISYSDSEGHSIAVVWTLNGSAVSSADEYIFSGGYNTSGSFILIANLTDNLSSTVQSWTLIINNTNRIPTVALATITPASPSISSDLTCNNGSISDPDNDAVSFVYDWYNGTWLGINNKVLSSGNLSIGTSWKCNITPYDGTDYGTSVISANVDINNTPPNITSYYPSSGSFSIAEPASQMFNITGEDAQSSITISWLNNGTVQEAYANSQTYLFTSDYASQGTYNITVVISDGSLTDSRSWSLTVNNTNRVPVLDTEIPDQRGYPDSDVSINMSSYFSDPDNDGLSYVYITPENMSVSVAGAIVNITPDSNWTGIGEMYLNCSDGSLKAEGNRFNITFTDDLDSDGHIATILGGDDCNDANSAVYPGASCSRSCYSGSTYDSNCNCVGGTYTCNTGGGGGGGGGGISLASTTIESSRYFDSIRQGEETLFEVRRSALAVKVLKIITNKDVSRVTLKVKEAAEPKHNISDAKVYQYIEIIHENLEELDFSEVDIEFSVNKSWIGDNNPEIIMLQRYYNGQWRLLDAEIISEDAETVHYTAASPGLSLFVIALDENFENEIEENITGEDITGLGHNLKNETNQDNNSNQVINQGEAELFTEMPVSYTRRTSYLVNTDIFAFVSMMAMIFITLSVYFYGTSRLNEFKFSGLEHYIEKRLNHGHLEEHIKKSLHDLGWPAHLVERHFRRAHNRHRLKRLEKYVIKRIKLGHKDHHIILSLVKMGFHPFHAHRHVHHAKKKIKLHKKIKPKGNKAQVI